MAIKNLTRNSIVSVKSRTADSVFGRALGLMFSCPTQSAMVLKFAREQKVSLHTYFVFYPIDIIFADARLKVVELTKMDPFAVFSASAKSKFVIEVPSGTIGKTKTKVGDQLAFFKVTERKTSNGKRLVVTGA